MNSTRTIKLLNYLLQTLLWLIFIVFPLIENSDNAHFWQPVGLIQYSVQTSFLVAVFYLNYFYLIPKLLSKRGIWIYLLSVILVLTLCLVVLPAIPVLSSAGRMGYQLKWGILAPAIQVYAVSASWRLLYDYLQQRLREKKLQESKRESELRFLRSQINPHFLFNTLNNINSLIRTRPADAEKSVVRLSTLMRYMLKSGESNAVNLVDEFDYLRNYIELQKLRLPADFSLRAEIPAQSVSHKIEPLLLVSFIENCFKHGIHGDTEDYILIRLSVNDSLLTLVTENRIDPNSSNREIESGIGLQNVENRLHLCYEGKYKLVITDSGNIYQVQLELILI